MPITDRQTKIIFQLDSHWLDFRSDFVISFKIAITAHVLFFLHLKGIRGTSITDNPNVGAKGCPAMGLPKPRIIYHYFKICEWQRESGVKASSFSMIARCLFFIPDTCWSVQFWICENTHERDDFIVAVVYDPTCIPGWNNSKTTRRYQTNTTAGISKRLNPHISPRSQYIANCTNTTYAPKTNGIHTNLCILIYKIITAK